MFRLWTAALTFILGVGLGAVGERLMNNSLAPVDPASVPKRDYVIRKAPPRWRSASRPIQRLPVPIPEEGREEALEECAGMTEHAALVRQRIRSIFDCLLEIAPMSSFCAAEPISFPDTLEREYEEARIVERFNAALEETEMTDVTLLPDCSEYPCLLTLLSGRNGAYPKAVWDAPSLQVYHDGFGSRGGAPGVYMFCLVPPSEIRVREANERCSFRMYETKKALKNDLPPPRVFVFPMDE